MSTDAPWVQLEMPNSFAERLKANLALTVANRTSLAWCVGFAAVGTAALATALLTQERLEAANIFVITLAWGFPPLLLLWNTWRAYKPYAGTPSHTIVIAADGIRSPSTTNDFVQEWKAIKSVRLRSGYLMLFTTHSAYVIPLPLFDRAQLERVAQFARAANVERVEI